MITDGVGVIETRRKTDGSGQRVFNSTAHLPASISDLRILREVIEFHLPPFVFIKIAEEPTLLRDSGYFAPKNAINV